MRANLPLHPDAHLLYGDSLRPPPGWVFDAGLATTFSLDMETALAVPVTLARFATDDRDELLKSPLALLEGLERAADRLAIFCEAGRIQAQAAPQSRLCGLLERLITEVSAPRGGSFHPKVWVLRFLPLDEDKPVQMRLLVLSRNLSRDRSWDTALCLDGAVGTRRRSQNASLADFFRCLPSLTVSKGTPPPHVEGLVSELSSDLHMTDWTLPAPFENVSFAANGIGGRTWSPSSCRQLGVISPFCDDETLEMLAGLASEPPRLVGRSQELIMVSPGVLKRFSEVQVMDEMAETEDGEAEDGDDGTNRFLSGLHAKVFVQENGWDTAITVGSGNATRPALLSGENVEVFATLTGKRSRVGCMAEIFGPHGFGRLLRSFRPAEMPQQDTSLRTAEQRLEQARRELVTAGLAIHCSRQDVEGGERQLWHMELHPGRSAALHGLASAICWPITRGDQNGSDVLAALRAGQPVPIGVLPLVDVTRFLAFRLTDATHGEAEALFSLGAELIGLPANRHQAVLKWILDSPEAFRRYLRLLLADMGDPLAAQLGAGSPQAGGSWGVAVDDEPILEDMVRALAHGRDRLEAVRRLMDRLDDIPDDAGGAVVPQGFAELWDAFRLILDERDQAEA